MHSSNRIAHTKRVVHFKTENKHQTSLIFFCIHHLQRCPQHGNRRCRTTDNPASPRRRSHTGTQRAGALGGGRVAGRGRGRRGDGGRSAIATKKLRDVGVEPARQREVGRAGAVVAGDGRRRTSTGGTSAGGRRVDGGNDGRRARQDVAPVRADGRPGAGHVGRRGSGGAVDAGAGCGR